MSNKTSTPRTKRQQPFLLVNHPDTKEASSRPTPVESKTPLVGPMKAASISARRTRKTRATPRRGRNKKGRGPSQVPPLPRPLDSVDVVPFHRRYLSSAALSFKQVTRQNLFMALGGIAPDTANVVCWASSYRVKRITAWPAAGTEVQITFWTSSGEQSLMREKIVVNTMPTGITIDRGSQFKPPRGTYLEMWQSLQSTSEVLFEVSCGSGSIVDIEGVYTLNTGSVQTPLTVASGATVTAQEVYYAPLDGPSGKLVPQGLESSG